MKRKTKLPELLSPAGSFECLIAAIEAGADAVYIGGKKFGARAFAKNFDIEEIKRAVRYAHLHGVRIYVTLNTLLFDREIPEALEYARELYRVGVDALIIADIGLITLIKRHLPDFELHGSTQMSIHNSLGADEAFALGLERVVLARELSGKNIADVTAKCKSEIEVFLHGALCVCHSGQCLFSSLVGGRSGNRGECAQPCRLPYGKDNQFPLSLTDLCLANHIRELCESGVASLKIEGRMKSPDYVFRVTSIYRRLLDEYREATEREMSELRAVFSRGGFTDKYFTARSHEAMTGTRGENDKSDTRALEGRTYEIKKTKVLAKARFILGKPSELTLWNEKKSVTVYGDMPTMAQTQPLTEDSLKERLSKMGQTMLSLLPENIELELDGGINLSPKSINALRREAAEGFEYAGRATKDLTYKKADLENKSRDKYQRARLEDESFINYQEDDLEDKGFINYQEVHLKDADLNKHQEAHPACTNRQESAPKDDAELERTNVSHKSGEDAACQEDIITAPSPKTTALFLDPVSYLEAEKSCCLSEIDIAFLPLMSTSDFGKAKGVYLPPVIMENEIPLIREKLQNLKNTRIMYALVGNLGHFAIAKEFELIPFGDFRLNITNTYTRDTYRNIGAKNAILSAELTVPQARDIGGFTIQMGRIPLMITERCFIRDNFGCGSCGNAALEDRMGECFPLLREFDHRNLIFNSRPTYMGDKRAELRAAHLTKAHFIFSTESASEISQLLYLFERGEALPFPHRRLGKREAIRSLPSEQLGRPKASKKSPPAEAKRADRKDAVKQRSVLKSEASPHRKSPQNHKRKAPRTKR